MANSNWSVTLRGPGFEVTALSDRELEETFSESCYLGTLITEALGMARSSVTWPERSIAIIAESIADHLIPDDEHDLESGKTVDRLSWELADIGAKLRSAYDDHEVATQNMLDKLDHDEDASQ